MITWGEGGRVVAWDPRFVNIGLDDLARFGEECQLPEWHESEDR